MAARTIVRRTKPSFPALDLTKPVDTEAMLQQTPSESCFSHEWEPTHKLCCVCADSEICGVLFNSRLTKKVREIEEENGGYLDNMHFDSIDKDEVKQLLSMKQFTFDMFVKKIAKFTQCPDLDTVKYWCKSYIIETKGVSLKAGIVIIK